MARQAESQKSRRAEVKKSRRYEGKRVRRAEGEKGHESMREDGTAIFYARSSDKSFQAFWPSSLPALCTMCLYPFAYQL
jgi:hypothetical protein